MNKYQSSKKVRKEGREGGREKEGREQKEGRKEGRDGREMKERKERKEEGGTEGGMKKERKATYLFHNFSFTTCTAFFLLTSSPVGKELTLHHDSRATQPRSSEPAEPSCPPS